MQQQLAAFRSLSPAMPNFTITSGPTGRTDGYADARAFYLGRGFVEEATIRDFYGPGDNKVTFWKSLAA